MSRPRKNNADYFSHDNDMRNDDKILSVRRKFWHEWYSIWNMLLEKLCKSKDFVFVVDNVSIELLSWDFSIDPEVLLKMIDYFVMVRLIVKEDDKIYSQKMIDRFEGLLSKRKRDIEYREWKQGKKIVIAGDKPQSKVKQSKVNKNRERDEKNLSQKLVLSEDIRKNYREDIIEKFLIYWNAFDENKKLRRRQIKKNKDLFDIKSEINMRNIRALSYEKNDNARWKAQGKTGEIENSLTSEEKDYWAWSEDLK